MAEDSGLQNGQAELPCGRGIPRAGSANADIPAGGLDRSARRIRRTAARGHNVLAHTLCESGNNALRA